MDRFSSQINHRAQRVPAVYTGPDLTRDYYLRILAEADARWRDRVSILAGRVLLISTLILGFLI